MKFLSAWKAIEGKNVENKGKQERDVQARKEAWPSCILRTPRTPLPSHSNARQAGWWILLDVAQKVVINIILKMAYAH